MYLIIRTVMSVKSGTEAAILKADKGPVHEHSTVEVPSASGNPAVSLKPEPPSPQWVQVQIQMQTL